MTHPLRPLKLPASSGTFSHLLLFVLGKCFIYPISKHTYCVPAFLVLFSHSVVSDCNPVDYSTPGFPILQHLPELAQIHVR